MPKIAKKNPPPPSESEINGINTEDEYFTREVILKHAKDYFDDDMAQLYLRFVDRCQQWCVGRNRITFVMGKYVVKLPWSIGGFGDNDWEGSVDTDPAYYNDPWTIQYARTRLTYTNGVPIVFMEYVPHLSYTAVREMHNGKEPDWVASVDCGQVGLNRNGRLVAYDYGYN